MQFLQPLLLWGALAAAVPVVIHLIHRRRFRRQRWAAMEWLLAAVKQNQKRLQMENLLLLLVRTLAVLFLALAIARPTFSAAPLLVAARQTHLFLVLDNSGSTAARSGTRTALDDGIAAVSSLLSGLGADDPVSLVLTNENFGGQQRSGRPRMVLSAQTDHGAVRRRLAELKPAPARADLDEALKIVESKVPAVDGMRRRVVVVTDLQEASFPERADRGDDPIRQTLQRLREKGAEVVLIPVGRENVANVGITAVGPADARDVVQGSTAFFQAELRNYSDRPQRVEVRFTVDGEARGEETSQWVALPARSAGPDAGPAQTAQFWTRFEPDDVGVHVIEARIRADALAFDDVRAYAFRVRPRIQVLAVDPDLDALGDTRPETYHLKLALAPKDDGPFQVTQMSEARFHALQSLDGWDVVILANVERPAPDDAARKRLEDFVRAGGALILTVGDHVVPARWNEELYRRPAAGGTDGAAAAGLLPVRLGAAKVDPDPRNPTQVLRLDLHSSQHALLKNIADPTAAVLFEAPFLHGRLTVEGLEGEKDAKVALAYDDLARSPALIEKKYGRGRVLLFTSTLDEAWGKFPSSYVYPALLHETVYWITSRGEESRNLWAFQPWSYTAPKGAQSAELTRPDGTQEKLQPESAAEQASIVVFDTAQLGVYRTVVQMKPRDLLGSAPPPVRDAFTVSMNPRESDLRRLDASQVTARYQDLLVSGDTAEKATAAARSRQGEIAVPLIAAALLCLLIEVLLVQRIGRRRRR